MRIRRHLAALLGLALLAGCGGQPATPPAAAKSPSPAASPSEPPLTKVEATAAANAINLTPADLGSGFTATPSKKDPANDADAAALATCVGGTPPSAALVDVSSPDFSKGSSLQTHEINSNVTVLPTRQQATADLAAYQGPKAMTCLKTFIAKALAGAAGPDVTFGPPVVTALDTPAPGADGSFGYALAMTAKGGGLTIPFNVFLHAVLVKRSEISLTVISIGPAFPAAQRARLLSTLVARATASAV